VVVAPTVAAEGIARDLGLFGGHGDDLGSKSSKKRNASPGSPSALQSRKLQIDRCQALSSLL
jgi:hypothetical protein